MADYLTEVARAAIDKCEENFGCKVGSLVTDNAANMTKTRTQLADDSGSDIIIHGCSAHLLNLLAHDVEVKGLKEHVVQIVKYFHNVHLSAAWYKAAGGEMPSASTGCEMEYTCQLPTVIPRQLVSTSQGV